jgi:AraC-like DNA-binding protein
MAKALFATLVILVIFIVNSFALNQPKKFYCPPCNCAKDGILFDRPGSCPEVGCGMSLLPVEGNFQKQKVNLWTTFQRSYWMLRTYDILILPAIIQGLILSLILVFRRNVNRMPACFLAALLIALSLQNIKFYYILDVLINYISNSGGNPERNIQALSFPFSGILLIGPSLYFYVRSLTESNFKFTFRDTVHFIPGFLFILLRSLIFFPVIRTDAAPTHGALINLFTLLTSIENILAITLSFYYIFISIRLTQKHELWVYQNFSNTSRKSLLWLRNLIVGLSIVWVVWLPGVITNLFTADLILTYLSSFPFQIITSVIVFWIGYVGFVQGEIFSMELSFEKRRGSEKPDPKKENSFSSDIKEQIIKAMESDKLFLIPELTLAMLSSHLNISTKNISAVLNSDLSRNFHDFINEYRVAEVKKRLRSPENDHLTLLAIAQDSGFNSKSSFNRVFMKLVKMSPKEYKEGTGQ